MNYSTFNIFKKVNSKYFVYNTFSGAIISLNEAEFDILKNISEINIDDVNSYFKHVINELTIGGFIERKKHDQINRLKYESYATRFNNDNLSLTIAPTTDCNFRCPYCYEKGIEFFYMSDNVIDDTITFINSKNKNQIDICWYGGEPLLAIDTIEKIIQGIKNKSVSINNSIVTNGYLLNDKNIEILYNLGFDSMQITLDGPKNLHDKRRFLKNGKGTFDVILNNIAKCYDKFRISIRVNVDKLNINFIDSLIESLKEKGIYDKVHTYLAPVDNINSTINDDSGIYYDNSTLEFENKQKEFLEKNMDNKNKLNFFEERSPYLCGAVSPHSFLIDPLGDLYKCWNDIGRKEYVVGNISTGLNQNSDIFEWLSHDPFMDSECLQCQVFPICLNGCPHAILRKNEKICNFNKNNYQDLLEGLV